MFGRGDKKERQQWALQVGNVFSPNPRDGSKKDTFWLTRNKEEEELANFLVLPGMNICLDGSTGTGKTSLALTELGFADLKYVMVQVAKRMTWKTFCRRLVTPTPPSRQLEAKLGGGLKGGLPHADLQVSLKSVIDPKAAQETVESLASTWGEHEVCEALLAEGAVLLVDDVERASDELLQRLSDMCKLLTQSYVSERVKLLIVGTDDVFMRLYRHNKSLEARIEQITLGTLPNQYRSWEFLRLGFEKLRLMHPGNDRIKKYRDDVDDCVSAVYEAANGLPKCLTQLGRDICLRGFDRSRITPFDIKNEALERAKRDFRTLRRKFPQMVRLVTQSTEIKMVLQKLYQTGIGQVHYLSEIEDGLFPELSDTQIEGALDRLVEEEFITRTGEHGDVIFVRNPRLAHLLGAIGRDPTKFGEAEEKFAPIGQLRLPMK